MTAQEIIKFTQKIDILLSVKSNKLIVDAPGGKLTDRLKIELRENKQALLKLLSDVAPTKSATIYTAIVDGKELTLIDINSKPYNEFKRGVINRFGADRVGIVVRLKAP